jgi:hypothetical protein
MKNKKQITIKWKYVVPVLLLFWSCNDGDADGYPKLVQLYNFQFQESSIHVKWDKSNESRDDFFSYKLYGSNDSLMSNKRLVYETFDQLDTLYAMSYSEAFTYFRLDVTNRLTGYNPIYFTTNSNVIYFNINEWVYLWDQYYSVFETRLDLVENQINYIPEEIQLMHNLKRLDLTNNLLSGQIPLVIFKLKQLETLILTGNQLMGVIPLEIDSLQYLETLFLNENFLSGEIPNSFCTMGINLGNPYRFSIEDNQFCPPYPDCLLTHMGDQNLSDCE